MDRGVVQLCGSRGHLNQLFIPIVAKVAAQERRTRRRKMWECALIFGYSRQLRGDDGNPRGELEDFIILVIMCRDKPDQLIFTCNRWSLVIGLGANRNFVASKTTAFNQHTKTFVTMKDREIGTVHADRRSLDLSRVKQAPNQEIQLLPDPYPHWTLKECLKQPKTIACSLCFGGRISPNGIRLRRLDQKQKVLSKIRHLTLSACSTSSDKGVLFDNWLLLLFGVFPISIFAPSPSIRRQGVPFSMRLRPSRHQRCACTAHASFGFPTFCCLPHQTHFRL
mmetsp:Transcript_3027/g.5668  ORF Transcript_3027/g.5668 Transcript_3027/m.5668 type:complete len:280 (-) Transcript_3027:14-853(-)